eukprot:5875643-Ditylum_brightwellii.AAC.1
MKLLFAIVEVALSCMSYSNKLSIISRIDYQDSVLLDQGNKTALLINATCPIYIVMVEVAAEKNKQ